MRDDDAGCLVHEDFKFQPFLTGDIDVVCRFVHQIEVRFGQPQCEQAKPRLLTR